MEYRWSLDFDFVVLTIFSSHHSIHVVGLVIDLLLYRHNVVLGVACLVRFVDGGKVLGYLLTVVVFHRDILIEPPAIDHTRC